MNIKSNISELIGNTPIIKLDNIYAKCEFLNPAGSIKDRVALNMVEDGIKKGIITKDSILIEATSGNTGIALASICASKGLKLIITMPETMSKERQDLISAYGAEIILTPAKDGMQGSINKANQLKDELNGIIVGQFTNMANPQAHEKSTALEILSDMDNNIDIFVSAVGTGGTISGVGKVLKQHLSNIKIVAIEPSKSAVLSGKEANLHQIQGIGAGFIPNTLDTTIYDEVVTIDDEDAINTTKLLAKKYGLLVGISSGANLYIAQQLAKKYPNKNIVTILCDSGERYLSTGIF